MIERDIPRRARRHPGWLVGLVLALLLLVNWSFAALVMAPAGRTTVSYTFFVTQVQRSNVADITTTGDQIDGVFRAEVEYRAYGSADGEQVERFTTWRPGFADDNLLALLQANGVSVNGGPAEMPLALRLLISFGPALLLTLLFAWIVHRRAGDSEV